MNKKILAMLMAAVMAAGALSGCSSASDEKQNTEKTSDETQEGETSKSDNAVSDGEVYEVVMQWPALGDTPAGLETVEDAVNAIVEPQIGVRVKLQPVNAFNLASETSLTVSSGEKLDLCLSLFNGVSTLVNTGTIIPLDDLVEQYGAELKAACDVRLTGGYYDGTLYAIPNAYINGEKYGFVCRKDLLDKYNIAVDEDKVYTMEDLGEIFSVIKEGEGDGFYCIGGTNSNSELFNQAFYPYDVLGATAASGVLMLGDDFTSTTVVNVFETEEYKAYAEMMYDWAQKKYFSADASTNTEEGGSQVRAGNYLGWFPGAVSGGADDYTAQCGTEMVILTTIPACSMSNNFSQILWSIPATCENPEKTMQFLNCLYNGSGVDILLQFGIEGQDYVIVEDNGTDKLIDYPEGLSQETVPYYQLFGVYGNRLNWPIRVPNTIDYNANLRTFNETVDRFSPALGYCFKTDSISSKYSAVLSVVNQYQAIISCGAVDPEIEIAEFNKALKAAGIDDVIAENQKQFDEWLSNK